MSEEIRTSSSSEVLRNFLLAEAQVSSDPSSEKDWSENEPHAVANGMPWIIGLLRVPDSDWARGELQKIVENVGLNSINELGEAVFDLRDQLRDELPEEDWNEYFKRIDEV